MAKYLAHISYTAEGLKGLIQEGATSRRAAMAKAIESLGGRLEALYYAFGDTDLYYIVDYPDDANVTAATSSLIGNASGAAKMTITVLLTPEEVDRAAELARIKMAAYRPPGR